MTTLSCLLSTIFNFSKTPPNFGSVSKKPLQGSGLRKVSLLLTCFSQLLEKETQFHYFLIFLVVRKRIAYSVLQALTKIIVRTLERDELN